MNHTQYVQLLLLDQWPGSKNINAFIAKEIVEGCNRMGMTRGDLLKVLARYRNENDRYAKFGSSPTWRSLRPYLPSKKAGKG